MLDKWKSMSNTWAQVIAWMADRLPVSPRYAKLQLLRAVQADRIRVLEAEVERLRGELRRQSSPLGVMPPRTGSGE